MSVLKELFSKIENSVNASEGLPEGKELNEGSEMNEAKEGYDFPSEIDETRADGCAEILRDVFDDETILNWNNLSPEERAAKINEYYTRSAELLGMEPKDIVFEQDLAERNDGYDAMIDENGVLHLDSDSLMVDSYLGGITRACTQSLRERMQSEAMGDPSAYGDLPAEIIEGWNDKGARTADSTGFSESVMDKFCEMFDV